MTIRNFDNIHSIRKEINIIIKDAKKDIKVTESIKRLLVKSEKTQASTSFITQSTPSLVVNQVHDSAIENLNNILHERQQRREQAEHIHYILTHQFDTEDGAVIKKLVQLSKQLVMDTTKLAIAADNALSEQGSKEAPVDFKNTAVSIQEMLMKDYKIKPIDINIKYYVAISRPVVDNKQGNMVYNIAYINVKSFKTPDSLRNSLIVLTRCNLLDGQKIEFIRTFTIPLPLLH